MTTKKVVKVSRRQVKSAQALVRISGGLDKVDPVIALIATAKPAKRSRPAQQIAS